MWWWPESMNLGAVHDGCKDDESSKWEECEVGDSRTTETNWWELFLSSPSVFTCSFYVSILSFLFTLAGQIQLLSFIKSSRGWRKEVLPRLVIDVVTPKTTNTFCQRIKSQAANDGGDQEEENSVPVLNIFIPSSSLLRKKKILPLFDRHKLKQLIVKSILAGHDDVNHIVWKIHSQKSKVSPAPAILIEGVQKRKSGRGREDVSEKCEWGVKDE